MAAAKIWLMQIRFPFLVLAPISVLVGVSVAVYEGVDLNALYLALAFIGALLAHIAVNVLNEYFDYQSGVDFKTVRTPFSGGSGVLVEGLLNPRSVYILGLACIAAIIAIGGYFFYVHGAAIIPLGLVGIVTIYSYTTYITRSPLLCAMAPGLGFGPLMVLGTYFALTGTYSLAAGLASIVPFFLVSNLLLLNQFPDVDADASADRRHLPIVIGRKGSSDVYALLLVAAYVALVISVVAEVLPYMALFGLLTLPLGLMAVRGARKYCDEIENLIPVMGRNVLLTLLLPLLMAIGIIIS
ncbi:MAG: prenyltransferase [Dehalococcoidia bacterium]|nr:MAG: prenyltransferase [Dehalococcoidia bacterium]